MYVCGLTVYDLPHIGHARTFVVFDVVNRYLAQRGFETSFVRNHTDVDDKIIRRAKETGERPEDLAQRMIDGLTFDMNSLGIKRADVEPRVTEHIEEIIALVQVLVDKGYAYAADGDVYYRVRKFANYGKLSGRNLDELESGVRVEINDKKEDPLDFALWKATKEAGEPSWSSPWGPGRPGWHIECSAMSVRHLGPSFDIHGGGRDLIFPHHENEVAQSIPAHGGEFARYWMHVGMVEIEGEKMSHSLDNFWTVRDILKQVHAEALRYFFLTTHYRNNINFSRDAIADATRRMMYMLRTFESLEQCDAKWSGGDIAEVGPVDNQAEIEALMPSYFEAMDDDFATPRALATLADAARLANKLAEKKGKLKEPRLRAIRRLRTIMFEIGSGVGLFQTPYEDALATITAQEIERLGLDTKEIARLVDSRTTARIEKDWAEADRIRELLVDMGVQVLDRPEDTVWRLI